MSIQKFRGNLQGKGQKHAILVSRFNEFITKSLEEGAIEEFIQLGVEEKDISVFHVPGAFEIPQTVARILESGKFQSVVCLGAVIRGATSHYDYVAGESAKIGNLGIQYKTPVIFGVLTTENIEQAIERAGTKAGNKGAEAARTAVEMVNLFQKI
jgi:6,7-dimethyl-8-ribityllumazine synthase